MLTSSWAEVGWARSRAETRSTRQLWAAIRSCCCKVVMAKKKKIPAAPARAPTPIPILELAGGLAQGAAQTLHAPGIPGTDLVAIIPERLALRVAVPLGLTVVEPPFGRVELIETLWWHPDRAGTPEHAWLRRTLTEAAASLPPVATGTSGGISGPAETDTWHLQRQSPRG